MDTPKDTCAIQTFEDVTTVLDDLLQEFIDAATRDGRALSDDDHKLKNEVRELVIRAEDVLSWLPRRKK